MRPRSSRPERDPNRGVTLLEMLVVLAIIAMIATITAPQILNSFGRAKSQAAKVQLADIKSAIQIYYLDTGQFPSQADGLSALLTEPSTVQDWQGPYVDASNLTDPWGREWIYRLGDQGRAFEVLTFGRDGQPGGTSEDSDISL